MAHQSYEPGTDEYTDKLFDHVVRELDGEEGFLEEFRNQRDYDDPSFKNYTFADGQEFSLDCATDSKSDGCTLIHFMVQRVQASSLNADRAGALTTLLLRDVPDLAADEIPISPNSHIMVNALELASSDSKCMPIVRAICESRMEEGEPRMEEESTEVPPDVLHSHCLHIALRSGNLECAEYLFDKMRNGLAAEKMKPLLYHRDASERLTPLLLAIRFKQCSQRQIDLVQMLIDQEPGALEVPSDDMRGSVKQMGRGFSEHHAPNHDSQRITGERSGKLPLHVKGNLTPYKYFLESRQNANSAPSLTRRRGAQSKAVAQVHVAGDKKEADRLADLLKLSCMRHFGRDREKLRNLLDFKNQIHFDLSPRNTVTARFLDNMAAIKFEEYLQYVHIPKLCVRDVVNEELTKRPWWDSNSRKDYAYIFEWLRSKKVRKIMRIKVEDDDNDFHSDELIEQSLKGFGIEEWNWFKWDMCIETICNAAPEIREVDLYWSGNKAILKSWAAEDGLARLKKLETLRITRRASIESPSRTQEIQSRFLAEFEEVCQRMGNPFPVVTIGTDSYASTTSILRKVSPSDQKLEEEENKEKWMKCTEAFAQKLKRWLNHELSQKRSDKENFQLAEDKVIKVAVIDDGVDYDKDDISKNVAVGETFYDDGGYWPGYYQSSQGHGHLMACIIRNLCPSVKLYIAKLNEEWVNGKLQIVPMSAVQSIQWATEMKVDIISMSWTIATVDTEANKALQEAVSNARNEGILLFCASDDQGNLSDLPYPAKASKDSFFKIGSATRLGNRDKATAESVNYIAPGLEHASCIAEEKQLGYPDALYGSSIATARCAGLAAMILQCVVLLCRPENLPKSTVREHANMEKMLNTMVESKDGNKYIKVWKVFEKAMNTATTGSDVEGAVIANVAREFLGKLSLPAPWEKVPSITSEDC